MLLLNVAPDLPVALRVASVVVGVTGAWFALRPLLPRRTLTAGPGLPSVVLLRGVLAAGFFGSEAYVPFLLQAQHGLSPSAAGLALTVAALSWAGASWVHGRLGERRLPAARAFGVGLGLVLVSLVAALAVALADLPAWVLVAGWFVGGAGMGVAYPRTSMLTLRFSTEGDDGFASSALTIADAVRQRRRARGRRAAVHGARRTLGPPGLRRGVRGDDRRSPSSGCSRSAVSGPCRRRPRTR